MIVYAIARHKLNKTLKLVEFPSRNQFDKAANDFGAPYAYRVADWREAHMWVKRGDPHETSLYVQDGIIRKARNA